MSAQSSVAGTRYVIRMISGSEKAGCRNRPSATLIAKIARTAAVAATAGQIEGLVGVGLSASVIA
ncbi:hypothetical protein CWT12_08370 [Actinomyces sp. 432]|nr:hypothetical protein CWT12_08370 [Actinomyces sp. 432]